MSIVGQILTVTGRQHRGAGLDRRRENRVDDVLGDTGEKRENICKVSLTMKPSTSSWLSSPTEIKLTGTPPAKLIVISISRLASTPAFLATEPNVSAVTVQCNSLTLGHSPRRQSPLR